jgi:hypothetical protein
MDHHNYSHVPNPEDSMKYSSKPANIWNGLSRLEIDDIKNQFKHRRMREIEEIRRFEADVRRIKDDLRKRKFAGRSPMVRGSKRNNMLMRQQNNGTMNKVHSSQNLHSIVKTPLNVNRL